MVWRYHLALWGRQKHPLQGPKNYVSSWNFAHWLNTASSTSKHSTTLYSAFWKFWTCLILWSVLLQVIFWNFWGKKIKISQIWDSHFVDLAFLCITQLLFAFALKSLFFGEFSNIYLTSMQNGVKLRHKILPIANNYQPILIFSAWDDAKLMVILPLRNFATLIFCLSKFCHFDILRCIGILYFDALPLQHFAFDVLPLRYFTFDILPYRYFAFDNLRSTLYIWYFVRRYFAISIFYDSIFCFQIFCPEPGLSIQTLWGVLSMCWRRRQAACLGMQSLMFIAEPPLTRHLSNAQLEYIRNATLV